LGVWMYIRVDLRWVGVRCTEWTSELASWPAEPSMCTAPMAGEHISADEAEMQLFAVQREGVPRRAPAGYTGGWAGYAQPIARKEVWLHCCSHTDVVWRRAWGPVDYLYITRQGTHASCPTR